MISPTNFSLKSQSGMRAHVNCPLCNKRLFRPESEIAGIGPVCQKRIKFAEKIESSELFTMVTTRERLSENNGENKTLIMKTKNGSFILATLLSSQSNELLYLDRQKAHKTFEKTNSIVDAVLDSLDYEAVENVDYVSNLDLPDHADLKRSFNNFHRVYQEELNVRESLEKDLLEKKRHAVYFPVLDKRLMTGEQLKNRETMNLFRENHPKDHNFSWANGVYQRSTFLARIQHHNLPEAIRLKDYLSKTNKFKNLEIKDYGLTDDEIEMGLTHSEQKIEALLFKAYSTSSRNINLMLALAEKLENLEPAMRIKAYRALSNMTNSFKYTKEDLKNDLK